MELTIYFNLLKTNIQLQATTDYPRVNEEPSV